MVPTTPTAVATTSPPDLRVVAVAATDSLSHALMSDGTVRAWGRIEGFVAGDSGLVHAFTPIEVPGIVDARAIFGGPRATCVIVDGGKVRCWSKTPFDAEELAGASQVSWPWAVTEGRLRCRGEPACLAVPGLAALQDTSRVREGPHHTCVLARGEVTCWGRNTNGQVAPQRLDDTKPTIDEATRVAGIAGAIDIAVADNFSCAVLADRTARCWGGVPDTHVGVHFPPGKVVPLEGVAGIDAIATGSSRHMCMVAAGRAHCLGNNTDGQVGVGSVSSSTSAQLVEGLEGVVSLAVGEAHTCAATQAGEAWCWGSNVDGELGDGTVEDRFVPRRVAHVRAPVLPAPASPADPPEIVQDFSTLPSGCVNEPLTLTAKGVAQPVFTAKATRANISFDGRGDALRIELRDRGRTPTSRRKKPGERSIAVVITRLKVKYGRASDEELMDDPEARKRTAQYLPIVTGVYRHWLWDYEGRDKSVELTATIKSTTSGTTTEVDYQREDPVSAQHIELTYVGKDWVCGKIDVKDDNTSISGRFAAAVQD